MGRNSRVACAVVRQVVEASRAGRATKPASNRNQADGRDIPEGKGREKHLPDAESRCVSENEPEYADARQLLRQPARVGTMGGIGAGYRRACRAPLVAGKQLCRLCRQEPESTARARQAQYGRRHLAGRYPRAERQHVRAARRAACRQRPERGAPTAENLLKQLCAFCPFGGWQQILSP